MANAASLRHLVCTSLAGGSFRCTGVQAPHEAVAAARGAGLDAALLDVSSLTHQDGLRLVRRLRDEAEDLPLVVVTASTDHGFSLEAMRIGVVDHLRRPFSDAELVGALDRAVSWRRAAVQSSQAARLDDWRMGRRTARLCRSSASVTSDAALAGWLSNVYRSDPRSHEHVRRVAQLTELVAGRIGVGGAELAVVTRAALLHDIGKLAIPRNILRKAGPLASRERELVRDHVRSGFAVAMSSPLLAASAPIVLGIRERFDGTGYPQRLKGAAIPLGARIVAVVEVLDALTSARGPLEPVSLGVANAELVRGAGARFDPDVVSAWLRSLDDLSAEWAFEPEPGVRVPRAREAAAP